MVSTALIGIYANPILAAMGIATRFNPFLDDGSLRVVPQRIAQELPHGGDAIPDVAGTCQKVLEVLIESESGKQARILDVRGVYWSFDDKGRVDESLMRVIGERIEAAMQYVAPEG